MEGQRTLSTGRWLGVRGVRPRGGGLPLRPLRGGKAVRKLGTRGGPVAMAVVEGINEDCIRADHFGERP